MSTHEIVVGLDDSRSARAALRWASDHARRTGVVLRAVRIAGSVGHYCLSHASCPLVAVPAGREPAVEVSTPAIAEPSAEGACPLRAGRGGRIVDSPPMWGTPTKGPSSVVHAR